MFIARRAPGPRSLGGNHFVDSLGLGRDALVEFARQFRDYVARRHGVSRTPGRPFSCLPSLLIAYRSLASSSWPQRSLRLQYLLLQEVDAADEALKPGI